MLRSIQYVGIALLACGIAVFAWPKSVGRSKSPEAVLQANLAANRAEGVKEDRLWQPVKVAMASGDVRRTRAAVAPYVSAGGQLGLSRGELGRFYLAKGDLLDAKSELDHVVDPFDPLVRTNVPRRVRPIGAYDAEALCLWLKAAANAPESEKQAVLDRWYANYNSYGHRPGILDDYQVTPEGLTELLAGQWCIGGKSTYAEAVEHYRRAVVLCPTSLRALKQLTMGLRFNGEKREAQLVDARARMLSGNPRER